jgi:DNA-binding phage protein
MALTRKFKETVQERAKADSKFRKAMLQEAVNEFLGGDFNIAKSILRNYINASVSFEAIAREINKNDKSVQRMLSPSGNPTSENLFAMLHAIQKLEGITLETKIHKN